MKKVICILSFILVSFAFVGQDTNTTIKIKKTKWKVLLSPSDSILWINKENQVKINVEGGKNYCVNIKDGK